jgi:hypothetical protein
MKKKSKNIFKSDVTKKLINLESFKFEFQILLFHLFINLWVVTHKST